MRGKDLSAIAGDDLPKTRQILMKFDRFLHSETALLCISQAGVGLFGSRQNSFGQPLTP
jgi:hypothetical protein